MTEQKQKKVARILGWEDNNDAAKSKRVTVRYRDDSETTLHNVGIGAWLRIKEEEFQHELNDFDADMLNRIVSRYVAVNDRESFIMSFRKLDGIRLCAWCQCYVSKDNEVIMLRLTPEEFEATRHTGESHGICNQCRDAQHVAIADMRNDKKAESPAVDEEKRFFPKREPSLVDRQDLADVEVVRVIDEGLSGKICEQVSDFKSKINSVEHYAVNAKLSTLVLEDELAEMAETVSRVERERDAIEETTQKAAYGMTLKLETEVAKLKVELDTVIHQRDDARAKLENMGRK